MFGMVLAAIGSLILIALVMSILQKVWRLVANLLRFLCAVALIVLAATGALLVSFGIQEGVWSGVGLGGLIVIVSVKMFLRLVRSWSLRRERSHIRIPSPQASDTGREGWSQFTSRLRWSQRRRAVAAESTIGAFLAEKVSIALSADHRSLIVSLERRVPELIAECIGRCERATASERREYLARALATVEQLAAEAERARREIRAADDHELNVLHRYFGQVSERRS